MITFGSLFAGIGGLDLGLERAGMVCRWQVEIDPFCRKVLAKHWPGVPKHGDIRKVTGSELEWVDWICGGYPCQPFSQAGKRAGTDDARHLWPEFWRLIRVLRPAGVLLENVPGHLSLGFGEVLGDLARLGYDAEWLCLRASDFGAAHLRKRVFVVAYRNAGHFGTDGALCTRGFAVDSGRPPLADSAAGGRGERGESSGRDGFAYGGDAELADARSGERERDPAGRWEAEYRTEYPRANLGNAADDHGRGRIGGTETGTGPGRERGRGPSESNGILADARDRQLSGTEQFDEGRTVEQFCGAFAPGPNDPRWPAILSARPDLAPALEKEIESTLRGMADGVSPLMDRTKRLKALGNAVVPQCAEWIGRRIMGAV